METSSSFDDYDDFEDIEEMGDEMYTDNRVVRIIDEMEFVEDNLDYLDESEFQSSITDLHRY